MIARVGSGEGKKIAELVGWPPAWHPGAYAWD